MKIDSGLAQYIQAVQLKRRERITRRGKSEPPAGIVGNVFTGEPPLVNISNYDGDSIALSKNAELASDTELQMHKKSEKGSVTATESFDGYEAAVYGSLDNMSFLLRKMSHLVNAYRLNYRGNADELLERIANSRETLYNEINSARFDGETYLFSDSGRSGLLDGKLHFDLPQSTIGTISPNTLYLNLSEPELFPRNRDFRTAIRLIDREKLAVSLSAIKENAVLSQTKSGKKAVAVARPVEQPQAITVTENISLDTENPQQLPDNTAAQIDNQTAVPANADFVPAFATIEPAVESSSAFAATLPSFDEPETVVSNEIGEELPELAAISEEATAQPDVVAAAEDTSLLSAIASLFRGAFSSGV